VENADVLCKNRCERRRKKNILAVWRLSGPVLLQCHLAPLGMLFVMKILEDEW